MSFLKRSKNKDIEILVTVKKGGIVVEEQNLASALVAGVKKRELNNMEATQAGDMTTLKCRTILAGASSPELAYEMSKAIKKSVADTYGAELLPYMQREIEERLGEVPQGVQREAKAQKHAGLELIDFSVDETDSR